MARFTSAIVAVAVAAALAVAASAAGTYSPATALTFAHLAGAAYCPVPNIWGWNGTAHAPHVPGFQVEAVLSESGQDTLAFVGYLPSADAVVVSYRGTSNFKNWIADLSFWKTNTSFPGCDGHCQVHAGFYKDYQGLQAQLHPAVESSLAKHPGAKLHVTGHSLGAALACLLATDLASVGHRSAIVITFGQPRVGDDAFFAYFKSSAVADEYYRVVHYHDIVPHLPPQAFHFHHVATEVWYNTEAFSPSGYVVCDGSGEDSKCSDSVVLPDSIDDHLHYLGTELGDAC